MRHSLSTLACVPALALALFAISVPLGAQAPAEHAKTEAAKGEATKPEAGAPEAAKAEGEKSQLPPQPAESGPLAPLAWLAGCWRGNVNQREFVEQWLPLRGGLMIGASHLVGPNGTQEYDYLRLEPRPDGVWYVTLAPSREELAFKLTGQQEEGPDRIFTFSAASADRFPQRIVYRRATEGWLYVQVEGTVQGSERKVIYPMRRVSCETGEFIRS